MPVRTLDPSDISDEERRQLLEELDQFSSARGAQEGGTCVLSVDGQEFSIPDRLADEVIHLLSEVASGREVSVDAQETELTTTEAAELLNVSRPHLVDLLEDGEIPFHKTGSHRRVYRRDVLEYKQKQRQEAEDAMQKLADQAQNLDMGY
jgi:excisionase family DNA binding protein